jgi:hypothetical protein
VAAVGVAKEMGCVQIFNTLRDDELFKIITNEIENTTNRSMGYREIASCLLKKGIQVGKTKNPLVDKEFARN